MPKARLSRLGREEEGVKDRAGQDKKREKGRRITMRGKEDTSPLRRRGRRKVPALILTLTLHDVR